MKNLTEGVDRRLILGPKFQELIEMQVKYTNGILEICTKVEDYATFNTAWHSGEMSMC